MIAPVCGVRMRGERAAQPFSSPQQGDNNADRAVWPNLAAKNTFIFKMIRADPDARREQINREINREINRTVTGAYQDHNRRENKARKRAATSHMIELSYARSV
jgi:hypothetical protein